MNRHDPGKRPRLLAWFMWWAAAHAGMLIVLIAFRWDAQLSETFCTWTSNSTPGARLLEILTSWGNPWPVTIIAAGSACFALIQRQITDAAILLAVPYAAAVSCNLIKEWVERQRPNLECVSVQADGFSFPSGHAVGVTTGFVLATLYFSSQLPQAVSTSILLLAGVSAELVSWSRVFVGAHFSVDVLVGQLLGAGWLLIAALLLHRQRIRRFRREACRALPHTRDKPVP